MNSTNARMFFSTLCGRGLIAKLLIAACPLMLHVPLAVADSERAYILYDRALAALERRDYAAALRIYRPMAKNRDPLAMYFLGVMHAQGRGVRQDYAQALSWYRKAADQGSLNAARELAYYYHYGIGLEQDYSHALTWWLKLSNVNDVSGLYHLGVLYAEGSGVPRDEAKAQEFLRISAQRGSLLASQELMLLQGHPKVLAPELSQGVNLAIHRMAAQRGDPEGQYYFGLMFELGMGLSKNEHMAAVWYRRAADQDHAQAQYNLALMYEEGRGLAVDKAQAHKWLRQAAENGNVAAQYSLGIRYSTGAGVSRDAKRAAAWFRKAAEQGDAYSQFQLGLMYSQGRGLPKDVVLAYFWWLLSSAHGHSDAVRYRDRIETQLLPHERDRAKVMAREWNPAP